MRPRGSKLLDDIRKCPCWGCRWLVRRNKFQRNGPAGRNARWAHRLYERSNREIFDRRLKNTEHLTPR